MTSAPEGAQSSRRAQLELCLRAALEAVDAGRAVRRALRVRCGRLEIGGRPLPDRANLVVLAVGKAAAAMAHAVEEVAGPRICDGLVVTKDGHALPLERLPLIESAHPVPDQRSAAAATRVLALVQRARAADVLLVLLSGGTSALLASPLPGLELDDLRTTTSMLLDSGAAIDELNTLRKHLCDVTGGRLARAAAAERIEVLAVSDVPGDRVDLIGSGPCAPDPSRFEDALAVLARRDPERRAPAAVWRQLERGARGELAESVKPESGELSRVRTTIIAANCDARRAATESARAQGLWGLDLGEVLAGEARVAGRRLAALGRGTALPRPGVLIAGGETSVTVRGPGRGGRNQELALSAAVLLDGDPRVALLAAGTDGSDGPTDAAGAYADGGSVLRGAGLGLDARAALDQNDSHSFFDREGGLLRTGPTGTNVMDLALIYAPGESRA